MEHSQHINDYRGDKNLTPANQVFNYLNDLKGALDTKHHVFFCEPQSVCERGSKPDRGCTVYCVRVSLMMRDD